MVRIFADVGNHYHNRPVFALPVGNHPKALRGGRFQGAAFLHRRAIRVFYAFGMFLPNLKHAQAAICSIAA